MTPKDSDRVSSIKGAASSYQKAAPYINISYVLIASIAMLGGIGWWLDSNFASSPVFFIFGILGGLFLGFYNLFKVVKKLENRD
jgi:F0F1-type ATP synthase assembly protein I